jgi:hypothetical protein
VEEASRPFDRLRATAWLLLVPAVAVFTLPFLLLELGPAYSARFGGTPGVFVASAQDCDDSGSCRWRGDFRSVTGDLRRTDVLLVGRGPDAVGDAVAAVDIGNDAAVYPEGGGGNWLIVTGLLLGLLAALAVWARSVRRRLWRRRADGAPGGG